MEGRNQEIKILEVARVKDGVIYIFAAYKFNSDYYKKEDLERAIKVAIQKVQRTLRSKFKDLTLQLIEQKQIQPGEYVGEFVKNSLDRAMITIFDLSDREPNVTFELGYSLGMAKYRFGIEDGYDILIQHNKVRPQDTISDLVGRFIVLYEYNKSSGQKDEYKKIQRKSENELKRKINNLLEDDKVLKRLIWRMYQEKVYVICPYIPPSDQERYGIRSSLAEYGDFNTVYDVCTFLKGVLNCDVKYFHSQAAKSIEDLLTNNLVIVGGPMWNDYAANVMEDYNLPYRYIWSPEEDFKDFILNKVTDKEYHTTIRKKEDGEDVVVGDYGIFGVLPNKYAEGKVIILISGITSAGGLGAARAFTEGEVSHQNCKLLVKTVGLKNYFVTLVESDIRWGEFTYPKRIKKSVIFSYVREENSWRQFI